MINRGVVNLAILSVRERRALALRYYRIRTTTRCVTEKICGRMVAFEDGGIKRRPRQKEAKATHETRSLRVGPSFEHRRHDLGVAGVGGGV